MSVTINGTSGLVFNDGSIQSGASFTGFRNRIINGDMRIDQRNAGASVTATGGVAIYTLDRWQALYISGSKFSVQQNAGSVTPPSGFSNYLGVTSLAATSLGTSDYYLMTQKIEGFNTQDLAFGTAGAKTVTVSFWVRSSLTGTFGFVLRNNAANRVYPATYTISSANTWEYKTVAVAGDTSGTWTTDNTIGLEIDFGLGVGSSISNTAGTWTTGGLGATGATSVVGTSGATWYITGVQLEAGSTATDFERRPYGMELALCQRYYQTQQSTNIHAALYKTGIYLAQVYFPVYMRINPVCTVAGGTSAGATIGDAGTTGFVFYKTTEETRATSFTASAEL